MRYTLCFLFLLYSCDTPSGKLGFSKDILDSKNRHVFVAEYVPLKNPVFINDTIAFEVKEAWLEHQWYHTNTINGAIPDNERYQLCVNTNEKDIERYSFDWSIGIDANYYMHLGINSLIGEMNFFPSDTIKYFVQKGDGMMSDSSKIIGKVTFIKRSI